MSSKSKNRNTVHGTKRHMTDAEIKTVLRMKKTINTQPLRKRIIYALRIIGGRW